ncbi:hypothetical protein LTR17_000310 [Elasticomyces elasticus]|nr:hypothetical protein LTR17_000310 [Elasticomyces elasticus]
MYQKLNFCVHEVLHARLGRPLLWRAVVKDAKLEALEASTMRPSNDGKALTDPPIIREILYLANLDSAHRLRWKAKPL